MAMPEIAKRESDRGAARALMLVCAGIPPSWSEPIAAFLTWGRKKRRPFSGETVSTYKCALRFWATALCERGIAEPREVAPADVEAVIDSKGWAGTTKGQRLNALSSFFEWARKHERADGNPVEDVERPAREDNEWPMLPPEHFCRMLACARDVLERALLLALGLTGARHDELLSIDGRDIIRDLPGVKIRKGKGGKGREVPLTPAAVEALNHYLRERPVTDCPALFVTKSGRRLTKRVLYRMWDHWLRDAGLADSGYVPHSCRVTFNTLLAWASFDRRTLNELMGHGTRRDMDVKYTRTDMPRKVWAVNVLERELLASGQGVFADGPVQIAGAGMQVGGGRIQSGVPEHLRQRVETTPALQHQTGEAVPQVVQGAPFADPRTAQGAAQDGRQTLPSQWRVGVGGEQTPMLAERAQLQPIGQGAYQTQGHGQDPALPALPAFDPHGALRQIDGRDLQGEQFRLAQPGEQQQPQYGAVPVGVGHGGLPLGSREEAVAFLHGQPGGQGAFPLRDGDAQERIGVRVPIVAQIPPQRAQRGEAAGDGVRLVSLGAQPRDVLPDGLPANVFRPEALAGFTETAEEETEVAGVTADGRGASVALDGQVTQELLVEPGKLHNGTPSRSVCRPWQGVRNPRERGM
jgi:site-specific recombinase XerC